MKAGSSSSRTCSGRRPTPTSATSARCRSVDGADIRNRDLADDDVVPEPADDLGEFVQAIAALVGDQDPQTLSLALGHSQSGRFRNCRER
jgi:hypothetical protein